MTWRAWVLNEVLQAVTNVHRAPYSIRRPSGGKESGYDKGESTFPMRSGMFSAGSHIHVGDRFKDQLEKINKGDVGNRIETHSKYCQTEKPELGTNQ